MKYKLHILFIITLAWGGGNAVLVAQNLVPNGSFEDYYNCPTSFGQWAEVVSWTSPYTMSADYYNACADSTVCSVPLNTAGYQEAAHGQAYMGFYTYATNFAGYYREVIATQLSQPLQAGVPVYVSFKASPGGFGSNVNNSATWAAKGPGINFFTSLPNDWQAYLFPNSSAVEMTTVLSDTATWQTISGIYVPDSAYSWLAITNFYSNGLSQMQLLDSTALSQKAYAFIDEVCVSIDPQYCSFDVGIFNNEASGLQLTASLVGGILNIQSIWKQRGARVQLVDMQGKVLLNESWLGELHFEASLPNLSTAMYILRVQSAQGDARSIRLFNYTNP